MGGKGQTPAKSCGTASALADLGCLVGVRALANIGVVVLHCFMLWQFFLDHQTKYELTRNNPAIKLASGGMLWVDVLLVLSATLAAYQLLPALEDSSTSAPTCRAVVLRYWRRRAARILPGYLIVNVLAVVALGPEQGLPPEAQAVRWINFANCPRNVWANLALLHNWLGVHGCATHLWTVSLQAQLYAILPLVLWALRPRRPGFRARMAATLAAACAGGTAWRLWAAWQQSFLQLPVVDFAVDQAAQLSWANMLVASYLPTASRVGQLAAGAALGALLQSPGALGWVHRRRIPVAAAALALQAAWARLLLHSHLLFRPAGVAPWPLNTARLHIALLSYGGPLPTALICATLLALLTRADPVHSGVARILASGLCRPLARLSYPQYLLHEHAQLWVLLYAVPPNSVRTLIQESPVLGFAALSIGTLAAGYAAAWVLHCCVLRRWERTSTQS